MMPTDADQGPTGNAAAVVTKIDQGMAQSLGARVMDAAVEVAQHEAVFLRLLGEFDAGDAVRWWDGMASTAHWVAWSCSIAPGTAREHVRVARALRQMPLTAAAFESAELSYSKVREITRLVGDHDEERLLELARHATASQLARTVSAYRACPGTHRERTARTKVSWHNRDDGCVQLSAVLTPEQGAAVVAALEAAAEANQPASSETDRDDADSDQEAAEPIGSQETFAEVQRRSRVDGLVEIAQHYLAAKPEDRSGEDRTTMVVEVSINQLVGATDTDAPDIATASSAEPDNVPAGTFGPVPGEMRCTIRDHAGIEPETARRLACGAQAYAVVNGLDGEPLAVGRTQRFGTRAQRRALSLRDAHCVFPGCDRTRHLKIHHVIPWYAGGPTDLDNLMLLCQHHHTAVHEGGIVIERNEHREPAAPRWRFHRPDGSEVTAELPLRERPQWMTRNQEIQGPRPASLVPIGGGEGFNLANCVEVLFNSHRVATERAAADRAAA